MSSKKLGNEVIKIGKEDLEVKKFKAAPGGTYRVKITNKSKLKPGKSGGTTLELHGTIVKGDHKKITFIDNIGSSVTWKIGQLLAAMGKRKTTEITLAKLLKMLLEHGDLRALLRAAKWEGKDRNEVVQWLPLKNDSSADDDEEGEDGSDDDDDDDTGSDDDDDSSSDDDDDDDDASGSDDDDDDDDTGSDDDDDDASDDSDDDDDDEDKPKGKDKKKDKKKGGGKSKPAAKKTAKKGGKKK